MRKRRRLASLRASESEGEKWRELRTTFTAARVSRPRGRRGGGRGSLSLSEAGLREPGTHTRTTEWDCGEISPGDCRGNVEKKPCTPARSKRFGVYLVLSFYDGSCVGERVYSICEFLRRFVEYPISCYLNSDVVFREQLSMEI